MYIKLTKLDNSPIWLNASFIVTIEPRKGGGSVVVPVGDGLDYDVREAPEAVLAMLEGAPAPAIVPIPTSDALTKTPDDVSPEDNPADNPPEAEQNEEDPKPTKKTVRKTTAKKRTTTRKAKKPTLDLPPEQVVRLRKMAPGTIPKLHNTLMTQFKVEDPTATVAALEAEGLVVLDGKRVVWQQPPSEKPAAAPKAEEENNEEK